MEGAVSWGSERIKGNNVFFFPTALFFWLCCIFHVLENALYIFTFNLKGIEPDNKLGIGKLQYT